MIVTAKNGLALCALTLALLVAPAGKAESFPPGTTAGSPGPEWDKRAWDLFTSAMAPAKAAGAGHLATFETWASDEDTYTKDPKWPTPFAPGKVPSFAERRFHTSLLLRNMAPHGLKATSQSTIQAACTTPAAPQSDNYPANGCIAEESRRNRISFDYIVGNHLYTSKGLSEVFKNQKKIQFPAESFELKADWAPVSDIITWLKGFNIILTPDEVAKQYYTTTVISDKKPVTYGLLAVHISSKDRPDWFWATFEQKNNPGRCDTMGCYDKFGATKPEVPPAAAKTLYGDCDKTADLKTLFTERGLGALWANYCLKASQIDFVSQDKDKKAILVGNSVTEALVVNVPIAQSSCMTCHFNASFNKDGVSSKNMIQQSLIGQPVPLDPTVNQSYDYAWGVINVHKPSKK